MSENCPKKVIKLVQEKVANQTAECSTKIASLNLNITETTNQLIELQSKPATLTEVEEAKIKDFAESFQGVNTTAIVESITNELIGARNVSINLLNDTITNVSTLKASYETVCEPLVGMQTEVDAKAALLLEILESARALDTQADAIAQNFTMIETPFVELNSTSVEIESVLVANLETQLETSNETTIG